MDLQPKLKRFAWRAAGLLAPVVFLALMALSGQAARAAAWQQETGTVTTEATTALATSATSTTATPGSETPSISVSPSATISATLQTQTLTPTAGVVVTLTPTLTPPLLPTATPFAPALPGTPTPTAAPPTLEPLPTSTLGPPTATLIPFPQVTYQYPQPAPTYTLLALQSDPAAGDSPKGGPPKGGPPFGGRLSFGGLLRGVRRAAPLLALGGLWLALMAWFVIVQAFLRKK